MAVFDVENANQFIRVIICVRSAGAKNIYTDFWRVALSLLTVYNTRGPPYSTTAYTYTQRARLCVNTHTQDFVDHFASAMTAMRALDIVPRPKFHACIHLACDPYFKGSPQTWATWTDEGLNKMLKSVGTGAHRQGWCERTLHNANDVLDRRSKRS